VEMKTLRGGARQLGLRRPRGLEVELSGKYLAAGDRMSVEDLRR
jgi:hypothetical protein